MSSTRPNARAPRVARPAARYRKGKAPAGAERAPDSPDEYESDESDEQGDERLERDVALTEMRQGPGIVIQQGSTPLAPGKINVALRDVKVEDGRVKVGGREEVGRTELEGEEEEDDEAPPIPDFQKPAAAESEEEEEESSEYETDSEEEEPEPMLKPVFVSKRNRETVLERERLAAATEEAERKRKAAAEERKKESHHLAAETIKRELAEKEAEENVPDVDDTDGLDDKAEFEAWRIRELTRIKRDKEAARARSVERAEIERRREMPEDQRLKEDLEHAKETKESKQKGKQVFLQKYYHKGAFYSDLDVLKKHDYTEATEGTIKDMSVLPKAMQVRNFGKASRSKYTHLADQDTSRQQGGFGRVVGTSAQSANASGQGCFHCGGPHLKKDCPHLAEGADGASQNRTGGSQEAFATGANNAAVKPRTWGSRGDRRERPRSRERLREEDGLSDARRHEHGRSPTRGPRRERDRYDGRDRDGSPRGGGRDRSRGRYRSRRPSRDRYEDRRREDRSRSRERYRPRSRSRDWYKDRRREDRSRSRERYRARPRSRDRDEESRREERDGEKRRRIEA